METKVLKILPHSFEGSDKEEVVGQYIYLLVTRANGSEETRRVFVSDDRLAEWAYIPKVGDMVHVFVSNGKVIDMLKVESKASRGSSGGGDEKPIPF